VSRKKYGVLLGGYILMLEKRNKLLEFWRIFLLMWLFAELRVNQVLISNPKKLDT
jgi:hypothetical protein